MKSSQRRAALDAMIRNLTSESLAIPWIQWGLWIFFED